MNTLNYSDLLAPLAMAVANLFFAGILYRTIINNSALLRRRHFFESFAFLAFAVALVLSVTGFILWRDNPRFVLVCSGSWILLCAVLAIVARYGTMRRANVELDVPEQWLQSPLQPPGEARRESGQRESPVPSPDAARPAPRAVPLDAFTRARLKNARRNRSNRSEDDSARDSRFRLNRPEYATTASANASANASATPRRPDRDKPRTQGRPIS